MIARSNMTEWMSKPSEIDLNSKVDVEKPTFDILKFSPRQKTSSRCSRE